MSNFSKELDDLIKKYNVPSAMIVTSDLMNHCVKILHFHLSDDVKNVDTKLIHICREKIEELLTDLLQSEPDYRGKIQ